MARVSVLAEQIVVPNFLFYLLREVLNPWFEPAPNSPPTRNIIPE
jgi:hypothetical protein